MAKIKITIEWEVETGRIDVNGPLKMKGLCHDLLNRAHEIVDKTEDNQKIMLGVDFLEKKEDG